MEECSIESPCVTAAVLVERLTSAEKLAERQREELDERLDKLEAKIDQALAERNMAIGAANFMARAGGFLMVAIPGLAWAWDHGIFDSFRTSHR